LSGARTEAAVQNRKENQLRASFIAHLRSVFDDPGPRSLARAVLSVTGTMQLIERFSPFGREKHPFRRSQMSWSEDKDRLSEQLYFWAKPSALYLPDRTFGRQRVKLTAFDLYSSPK